MIAMQPETSMALRRTMKPRWPAAGGWPFGASRSSRCCPLAATVIYLTAERLLPRPEWLSRLLFGCSVKELASETPTGPAWLESILSVVARFITAPLAIALFAVLWLTAFVRIRRELTPFLISRAI